MRAYGSPKISNQKALSLLKAFSAQPEVAYRPEPDSVEPVWHQLTVIDKSNASPKVWMDAYLAAFAICADIALATLDSDFVKFQRHGLDLKLLTP